MSEQTPLKIEDKAQKFNEQLKATESVWNNLFKPTDNVAGAKQVTQKFLDEVLNLPLSQQKALLKQAETINDKLRKDDSHMPAIHAVFSNKTGELSDFKLTYIHQQTHSDSAYETIDMFDP
ncbi:MAG: hypothetical protein K2X81_18430 [Candidatus Obscuribacterales bacterium]|jgi:hypothetical protein|nr:hypothetical protein [Candidatus Obscuribacterales bacterium]